MYGYRRIVLPTPRYYVFFSGDDELPDRDELHLSDSFSKGPGDVEVTVTVINVNEQRNPQLMAACQTLAGYAHLVKLIRGYSKSMELGDALDVAVQQCVDEGVLADCLKDKRAKVKDMFLTGILGPYCPKSRTSGSLAGH